MKICFFLFIPNVHCNIVSRVHVEQFLYSVQLARNKNQDQMLFDEKEEREGGGRVRGPFFDIRISANCRISVFGNVVNSTEVKNPTGPTMKFGNFIL